jgi:hypothetical protein
MLLLIARRRLIIAGLDVDIICWEIYCFSFRDNTEVDFLLESNTKDCAICVVCRAYHGVADGPIDSVEPCFAAGAWQSK